MGKHIIRISAWAAVVLLALLSGCGKNSDEIPVPSDDGEDDSFVIGSCGFTVDLPHYLLRFFVPEKYSVRRVIDETRLIVVEFSDYGTEEVMYDYRHAQKPEEYAEKAGVYESLCSRYKDTAYPKVHHLLPYWCGRNYPVNNIVSIAVVSDADYDSDHPAGSSLADICEVLTASPRDFIASGYTDTCDWTADLETLSPVFGEEIPGWGVKEVKPVYKRLDKCWAEDLVLAGYYPSFFTLRILQAPAADFNGRFTITLLDEKGKVFTLETEPVSWRPA